MQTYEILVKERSVLPNSTDMTLVRTSIGIDEVHVMFDNAEWLDFPISITFGNGETVITQSLTTSALTDIDGWVAEGTCTIPWEVTQTLGAIRVTLQGTDSSGNHIITAYGAPLTVEECGDTASGTVPEPAPSQSEWEQAYADAQVAINSLQSKLDEANAAIARMDAWEMPTASTTNLGAVKPDGETVTVDADGTIHAESDYELPIAASNVLGGVQVGNTLQINEFGTLNAKVDSSLSSSSENPVQNKAVKTALDQKAPIASPALTGLPTAPTAASNTDNNQIATTSFVQSVVNNKVASTYKFRGTVATYAELPTTGLITGDVYNVAAAYGDYPAGTNWAWDGEEWDALGGSIDLSGYAQLASPTFTGTPAAPTASSGTDTTQIATTAFVQQEIDAQETATQSDDGLMSATDKTKLDGIESGANNYVLPTMSASTKGGAKLGSGLTVDNDTLSLGNLTQSGSGAEVVTHGCALYSVEGEGWAEQTQTTGKNLLDPNSYTPGSAHGASYVLVDDEFIVTATGDSGFYLGGASMANGTSHGSAYGPLFPVNAGDNYTLSVTNPEFAQIAIGFWDADMKSCGYAAHWSGAYSPLTGAVPSDARYATVRFGMVSSFTGSTYRVRVQLEADSTATSYEPHSGGLPSPRPDWKQPIRVCRGRNLQKYPISGTRVDEGITFAYQSDGSVIANGTLVGTTQNAWSAGAAQAGTTTTVLQPGTYTASVNVGSVVVKNVATGANIINAENGRKTAAFTISETTSVYAASAINYENNGNSLNVDNVHITVQLEAGSTATSYVPYGHVGLEVRSKNLLPFEKTLAGNEIHFGDSTATPIALIAGTYTFSCANADSSGTTNLYVQDLDTDTRYVGGGIDNRHTFTIPNDCVVKIWLYKNTYTSVSSVLWAQLEAGSQETPYVPFFEPTITPIPLPSKGFAGALPDGTADTLAVDSAGRYEWVSETGETSEALQYLSGFHNSTRSVFKVAVVSNVKATETSDTKISAYCTHAIPTYQSSTWVSGDISYHSMHGLCVTVSPEITTLEQFSTAYPSFKAFYPLATPTTEHGYIDLPDLPEGATVSIPELEGLGVSWFVTGAAELVEHATNERKRVEDALADVYEAIADL